MICVFCVPFPGTLGQAGGNPHPASTKRTETSLSNPVFQKKNAVAALCKHDIQSTISVEIDGNGASLLSKQLNAG